MVVEFVPKMAIGNGTRNVITYTTLNKGLGWLSNKEKVTIMHCFLLKYKYWFKGSYVLPQIKKIMP